MINLLHELFPDEAKDGANDPNLRIKLRAAGSMSAFDQIFGLRPARADRHLSVGTGSAPGR